MATLEFPTTRKEQTRLKSRAECARCRHEHSSLPRSTPATGAKPWTKIVRYATAVPVHQTSTHELTVVVEEESRFLITFGKGKLVQLIALDVCLIAHCAVF